MEKTALKIRVLGDPVLRKRSVLVKQIMPWHKEFFSRMAQMMYEGQGIGLAAPQAGVNEAMIVVDIGNGLYKLVNPKIVWSSGYQVNQEGCLSVPGVCINVKRAQKIRLKAMDEEGKPVDMEAQGLLACVFQHEIDHLKGRLIVDYASFLERLKIKKVFKKLKGNTCNINL